MVPSSMSVILLVRDFLAQFTRQKRRVAVNRAPVDGVENVAEQGARHARFKDHRHALRLDFDRAQPPQRAFGRFAAHCLRHLRARDNRARMVNQ